jgi:hypothetical protein
VENQAEVEIEAIEDGPRDQLVPTTNQVQPLILRGSHAGREARAEKLVKLFVKFISDNLDLLVQVREDFLTKPRNELIMGCSTFTQYCENVLHYSEGHIRRLIAGRNPATAIHDGSKNRKVLDEDSDDGPATCVDLLNRPKGFVSRCDDPILRALALEQARLMDLAYVAETREEKNEHYLGAATLEGQIVYHICYEGREDDDWPE